MGAPQAPGLLGALILGAAGCSRLRERLEQCFGCERQTEHGHGDGQQSWQCAWLKSSGKRCRQAGGARPSSSPRSGRRTLLLARSRPVIRPGTGRLFRDGIPDTCAAPGTSAIFDSTPRHYGSVLVVEQDRPAVSTSTSTPCRAWERTSSSPPLIARRSTRGTSWRTGSQTSAAVRTRSATSRSPSARAVRVHQRPRGDPGCRVSCLYRRRVRRRPGRRATSTTSTTSASPGNHYTITTETGRAIVPGVTDLGSVCDGAARSRSPSPSPSTSTASPTRRPTPTRTDAAVLDQHERLHEHLPAANHGRAFFPYWDDLRTDGGGGDGIYMTVTGSAPSRTVYVEWRTTYFSGGGTANFEFVANENDQVLRTIYGTVSQAGASSTEGVQDTGAGIFDEYGCNGAGGAISSSLAVIYTPGGGGPPPPPPPPPGGDVMLAAGGYNGATTVTTAETSSGGPWTIRAPMPGDLYGGAAASDGTYAYVAGGYSFTLGTLNTLFRYDPAANSWSTRAPMPDGFIMGSAVYPTGQRSLRLRWLRSCHRRQLGRDQDLRRRHQQLERRPEHAGRAQLHGLRLQPRQRQDLPRRRLQHRQRLTGTRPDLEFDPVAGTFTNRALLPHALGGAASGSSTATSTRRAAAMQTTSRSTSPSTTTSEPTPGRRGRALPAPNNVPSSAVFQDLLWTSAVAVLRSRVAAFTTQTAEAPDTTNQVMTYDPSTNSWATLPASTRPARSSRGRRLALAAGPHRHHHLRHLRHLRLRPVPSPQRPDRVLRHRRSPRPFCRRTSLRSPAS